MQRKEMLYKSNQLSDPVDAPEHQVNAHSRRNSSGNGRKIKCLFPSPQMLASSPQTTTHTDSEQFLSEFQ